MARMTQALLFLAALGFLATSQPVLAQYLSDVYSARSLGMGGAMRASASDSSALDLNPAALARFSSYQVELGYRRYGAESSNLLRLSFIDNLTSQVGSAASYTLGWSNDIPLSNPTGWTVVGEANDSTQTFRLQDYKLGFGVPLGPLAWGATLDWRRQKLATEDSLDNTDFVSTFSIHSGLLFKPNQALSFALVGTNLVQTHDMKLPTAVSIGAAAAKGILALAEVDFTVDLTGKRDLIGDDQISRENLGYNLNVGGQILAAQSVPVRFGFYTESLTKSQYFTSGLGLEVGQIRVSYGMRVLVGESTGEQGRFYHMFLLGSVLRHK